jgi:hypothetical protein
MSPEFTIDASNDDLTILRSAIVRGRHGRAYAMLESDPKTAMNPAKSKEEYDRWFKEEGQQMLKNQQ